MTFYTFKQKTKRTEQSLISMFVPETNVEEVNIACEIVKCPLCEASFENGDAYIEHAQQEHHDVDVYELENESAKVIKANIKEAEIEVYDFGVMTNGENSSEAEIITDEMVVIEEEPPEQSARSLRSRVAGAKAKLPAISNQKAKKAKLTEKASTSKMVVKSEISDMDENTDINDDYDFEQTESESFDLYECPLCGAQFADRNEYVQHCKDHDGTEYQCEGCNEFFSDEDHLLQHECDLNDRNVDEEDLLCVPCNKRMKSTVQLRQHSKMHDSMSLIITYMDFFPCHDCCLLFISKDKLNEHNLSMHTEKVGKDLPLAEKIDESCTDYQFLDGDVQSEYKEGEVYSCGECNQSYQTILELKYHVILHAHKFECPIEECGCQYDQMSRLSIHVLNKHINTKNLQCLHCSQAFQSYDDLQTHLKHFCKEKKFKCYECGTNSFDYYWRFQIF